MLPLRYAWRWQAASILILLIVLAFALMPAFWLFDSKVKALSWFHSVDKWLHGITFLILSVWFSGLFRRTSYWRVAIGLLAFGFVIEACQRMVIYRTASVMDIAADAAGIVVGLAIGIAGAGKWCLWLEKRMSGESLKGID